MNEQYVYCTLSFLGNSWCLLCRAKKTPTGGTETGTHSGYGDITNPDHEQHNLIKGIPVIDLRGDENALDAVIDCPDDILPRETHPMYHRGTLETYLAYLKEYHVKVLYFD